MPTDCTPLLDRHGRRIEYIRVSITDRCNFRCPFCMPAGIAMQQSVEPSLEKAELLRLAGIIARLGVDNFKLTGGEPFVRPDALAIIRELKTVPGIRCVTVTTNGSTLDRHAEELAAIGVDGINVSLNAMTQETFAAVTGAGASLATILGNILLAKRLGLKIKLNMVPMRGVNDADIIPYLEFALANGIYARFIELMPIGEGRCQVGVPQSEVRRIIEKRFGSVAIAAGRFGNGPAVYYNLKNHSTKIGYIAAVSRRFCDTCNRIRLTSKGFLRTCLHHAHGIDLAGLLRNGATDSELAERIRTTVAEKPGGHRFGSDLGAGAETDVPMFRIGG